MFATIFRKVNLEENTERDTGMELRQNETRLSFPSRRAGRLFSFTEYVPAVFLFNLLLRVPLSHGEQVGHVTRPSQKPHDSDCLREVM